MENPSDCLSVALEFWSDCQMEILSDFWLDYSDYETGHLRAATMDSMMETLSEFQLAMTEQKLDYLLDWLDLSSDHS